MPKVIGIYRDPITNQTMPVIATDSFLESVEGWNLYCRCQNQGDMTPFHEAKAKWEQDHAAEIPAGKDYTWNEFKHWSDELGEGLPAVGPRVRGGDHDD